MSREGSLRPPRWAWPASLGLTLAGLAVAAYLTVEHYASSVPLACPETGTINCAKVITSSQSVVLGVPVAVLGLLWFLGLVPLLTPAAWRSPRLRLPRLILSFLGVPAVLYLIYVELFSLHAICLYCTAVHVLAVCLFGVVALATALTD